MGTTTEVESLPTWPVTLPIAPLLSALSEQYPNLTTSVTSGNKSKLIRKVSTRAQVTLVVNFNFTEEEVGYFTTFVDDTLEGGAMRFTFTHPRTGASIETSFDPTQTNRFTIEPNGSMSYFKVTTQFLIWS